MYSLHSPNINVTSSNKDFPSLPKMTTTEHVLLTVKEHFDNAAEREALKTLLQQPGLQAVLKAVAEEDKTKLLWLVGT